MDEGDLQNETKLLEAASPNKILLGKRDWKLDKIPEVNASNLCRINQQTRKKKNVTNKESFYEEEAPTGVFSLKDSKISPMNSLFNLKTRGGILQNNHNQFDDRLKIGKSELKEPISAENFEDYFAYDLRENKFLFCLKIMNYLLSSRVS